MNVALKQYWVLLAGYLRPQRLRVVVLAVLIFGGIGLELLNPQILRYFIDTARAGGALSTLVVAAILFLGIALAQQLLAVAATYAGENVAWTATNLLRADLAAHCLRLDMSFHKSRTPGELIERIDGDVNALSNFFSQFAIGVVSNLVLLIGVLILLFREDWRVGAGLGIFAFVALFVLVRIRGFAVPYWDAVRDRDAAFFGFLSEQLAGTEDVRASGATGFVMRRFYEMLRAWLPVQIKAGLAGATIWSSTIGVFAIGNAVAFALGAYLYRAGTITIGTVYLIFYYTELLRRPIEQFRTQLQDLQKASASIGRIEALFNTRSKVVDGPGQLLPSGPLSVEFRDVSFGYDEDALVLQNVEFCLHPGKVLGLLGRTGSGKTTLARLLLRLYDPSRGEIRVGGVAIHAAHLHDLRRHVGIVTQDVQLFNATVRDNLAFFNRSISDERIIQSLDELGLGAWYRTLPNGLDTELESGGGGLSAGEAQLLAFVRLFLADPGLVILDEATARLDPATEELIEQAVGKLLRNRTGIIIAHRLPTVERADEILILEHGSIIEHGRREHLASDPTSHFVGLLRTGLHEVLA
ncbi:MAG TPA: ABC transporter ATP-binding protein [Herpetosiphonaceae bacterium]|nr:ABC transporter ATP-binding protein [Herpetosiphonaceae bacterium]